MEQDQIADLLRDGSDVAALASAALRGGGVGIVWDEALGSEPLARICRRRLGLTRRTGQETVGLERAVEVLSSYRAPVRLGHVTSPDGCWVSQRTRGADEVGIAVMGVVSGGGTVKVYLCFIEGIGK
ncbi:hypothetical protein GCM10009601_28410 [Streptomyces thermospinosisporus]|uniref:Uncharacterized protein n=1 Tax=Streptomyces thermospinosisporus TaxID=161482 RepID=A0ABP4JN39_9ACTN